MRVLHLCPLWSPIAPDSPGSISRYLFDLLASLERQGCTNTLLASGDSQSGRLHVIPVMEGNLVEHAQSGHGWQPHHYELHELMLAARAAFSFDVVHSHLYLHGHALEALRAQGLRVLHSEHKPLTRDLEWLIGRHPSLDVTTVSRADATRLRDHVPGACAVPPGMDFSRLSLASPAEQLLVYAGEVSHDCGADIAVEVAERSGLPLVLAGPVPKRERPFFHRLVRPRLGTAVRYAGDVDQREIAGLLARASCLLMPARRHDYFPLTALESMACGTPVVALDVGVVGEVIDDGHTGFLAGDANPDRLSELVRAAGELDRARVRDHAAARFDITARAERYRQLYDRLASEEPPAAAAAAGNRRRISPRRPQPLRVLHLSPLWYPVAQSSRGGIETLLPALISALNRLGCQNALVASGDSRAEAELIPVLPRNVADAMQFDGVWEYEPYAVQAVIAASERANEFDVIHSHLPDGYFLSAVDGVADRVLHTLHEPVTPDFAWFAARHPELRLALISDFQARRLRELGVPEPAVVPNGLDVGSFRFHPEPEPRLAFLGAMVPEKGPDLAMRVAAETRMPLTLAGPIASEFFAEEIEPGLNDHIRYAGVVDHVAKNDLLGQAACVLMPSRWEEPFGLVAIEAMACGTPVVALARGALPEIVEDGVTGYLAAREEDLAPLVARASQLDRARVRASVVSRFDIAVVARRYLDLYRQIAR